jgi:hypothetical protein
MMEDVFQVNHRHVVFTIDDGLWSVFLLHRKMLKDSLFMDEAGASDDGWDEDEVKRRMENVRLRAV